MEYNPGSICPIACRKCGDTLIVEKREFKGIEDRKDAFDTTKLIYHLILSCPKRLKFFSYGHDHREFSEDCAYEYVLTDK